MKGAKKRYEEKSFIDPRKPIDWLLYQGARFINHSLNGLGVLLDIVGAPFRYAIELINFGIMSILGDTEGIKRQRKNLAKFDARVREGIRQLLNVATLGFGFKEKGSFGNLFGDAAAATKEMVKNIKRVVVLPLVENQSQERLKELRRNQRNSSSRNQPREQ